MEDLEIAAFDNEKGVPIATIPVSDQNKLRKNMPKLAMLEGFSVLVILSVVLFFLDPVFFLPIIIIVDIALAIGEIFVYLILSSTLGRSFHPIVIYSSGIQFHSFPFDRMLKNDGFVQKDDIEEIQLGTIWNSSKRTGPGQYCSFSIRSKGKKNYSSGARLETDVQPVLDRIQKDWGVKIRTAVMDGNGRKVSVLPSQGPVKTGRARKVRISSDSITPSTKDVVGKVSPRPNNCEACGSDLDDNISFCPTCGHQSTKSNDTTDTRGNIHN